MFCCSRGALTPKAELWSCLFLPWQLSPAWGLCHCVPVSLLLLWAAVGTSPGWVHPSRAAPRGCCGCIPVPTSITHRENPAPWLWMCHPSTITTQSSPYTSQTPRLPLQWSLAQVCPQCPKPTGDGGSEPPSSPVSSLHTQLPKNKHSSLNVSSPQPLGLNIGFGSAPGGGTSGFRLKQIVMNPICSVNMLSECFFR